MVRCVHTSQKGQARIGNSHLSRSKKAFDDKGLHLMNCFYRYARVQH